MRSGYAQPLSARIPITLTDADHIVQPSELSVRLLPYSAYEGMGLGVPPLNPENVQISVNGAGLTYWVDISSTQRVREPMMTLLMEVRLAGVRIVRELPILFDLPTISETPANVAQSQPAAVPVPADETEISVQPLIAPMSAPSIAAPVALIAATDEPVRKRPVVRRQVRKPKPESVAVVAPQPTTFRLADWNQSGVAPSVLLPRFQLAQRFDSYIELAEAGIPPIPATLTDAQMPAADVAADTVPGVTAEQSASSDSNEATAQNSGLTWLWGLLLAGLSYPLVRYVLRRSKQDGSAQQVADISLGRVVAVTEPVVKKSIPVATVIEAEAKPAKRQAEAVAQVVVAPLEPERPRAVAPVETTTAAPLNELKKRLADLVTKGANDPNMLRKAQLVSAYLDLDRIESAELLLSELEAEAGSPSRARISLIKG